MAFVEIVDLQLLPLFCNIHASVGPRCVNGRTDVLLVQYLLKVYFQGAPIPSPIKEPLEVDGWAGNVTFAYIKLFQTHLKTRGHNILPDGRVDRAQGFFGNITGSQYTITHLNNAFNMRRPGANRHLWCESDCPPDLRAALIDASRPKNLVVETHGGGV
jgi:hypothetical protein